MAHDDDVEPLYLSPSGNTDVIPGLSDDVDLCSLENNNMA
jgi:hypothetical protein